MNFYILNGFMSLINKLKLNKVNIILIYDYQSWVIPNKTLQDWL